MEDAKFGVCPTCGVDVTRRTTYQFPEDFGQKANTYVFCSYDCMTSWLYRHIRKEVYVRPGELKGKNEGKNEGKDEGSWF